MFSFDSIKYQYFKVIECSIIDKLYMGLGYSEEALQTMKDLKQNFFKYNENFSLLWCNSYLKTSEDKKTFEEIVQC